MTYTQHLNKWVDFLKQKLEVSKRLYSPTSSENYEARMKKITNRQELLELEYAVLKEITPTLERLSSFYNNLRAKHMSSASSDELLKKEEAKVFEDLDAEIKLKFSHYLTTLESILAEQESYSGRVSTKKSIIPPLWDGTPTESALASSL